MTEERGGFDGKVLPGYTGRPNDSCVTIAEVLKDAGYFLRLLSIVANHAAEGQSHTTYQEG